MPKKALTLLCDQLAVAPVLEEHRDIRGHLLTYCWRFRRMRLKPELETVATALVLVRMELLLYVPMKRAGTADGASTLSRLSEREERLARAFEKRGGGKRQVSQPIGAVA